VLSLPRVLTTLSGAAAATFLVAWLEGISVAHALRDAGAFMGTSNLFDFVMADAGVLAPLAQVVALATLVGSVVLEPEHEPTLIDHVVAIRSKQMNRMRAAALTPAFVVVMFVATVGAAHAARHALGMNNMRESGLSMAIASVAMTMGAVVVALALLPWFWMLLARYAADTRFADPLVTGGIALAIVIVLMGVGIATGDAGGSGGLPGVGIFATLARPELDLRPVVYTIVLAAMAFLGGKLGRHRFRIPFSVAGVVVIVATLALTARASASLDASPELTQRLERSALGKLSLAALRKATDRDRDGYSPRFGGGDCDDADPRVNPTAIDVPGNGLDEDCTGQDARVVAPPAKDPSTEDPAAQASLGRTYNVVLITVDTLRSDLGFAGYPRPVTPNIDKLAAQSIVFERAYSTASYTAKAMGALMMGKYSSEAARDWDHYTTYHPSNTFIAQRARAAGAHTFAGHCHYYFMWPTGYQQGFKNYDTSAIAPQMADNDSSITSDRLSDLVIRMLSRPENVQLKGGQRFFSWFHYFDPHTQYVPHAGAPDFASMPGGPPRRALYDGEVWFTDKHIGRVLDFIQAAPFGPDTAVIITADHGEAFGDAHGVKTHAHELWESLVRVPLVVYVPGLQPKRVKVKRSHVDVGPTILALLGAPSTHAELRGKSLLADARTDSPAERDVYLDMPEGPYNDVRRALITGPSPGLKLIHFGGKNYQLYDLAADPGENEDLARDPAKLGPVLERMESLRAGLKEISVVGPRAGK
jgi:arylsulfatase A-like enzyme